VTMAKRILTVDDSKTMRDMVSFTLKKAGYEVGEAEDGKAALAVAEMRKSIAVDILQDYFAEDRLQRSPVRSARIAISFSAEEPDQALAVVRDLGLLVAQAELGRHAERANRQAQFAGAASALPEAAGQPLEEHRVGVTVPLLQRLGSERVFGKPAQMSEHSQFACDVRVPRPARRRGLPSVEAAPGPPASLAGPGPGSRGRPPAAGPRRTVPRR